MTCAGWRRCLVCLGWKEKQQRSAKRSSFTGASEPQIVQRQPLSPCYNSAILWSWKQCSHSITGVNNDFLTCIMLYDILVEYMIYVDKMSICRIYVHFWFGWGSFPTTLEYEGCMLCCKPPARELQNAVETWNADACESALRARGVVMS